MLKSGTLLMIILGFFSAGKVGMVNMEQLQAATAKKTNDTLYVLNFWATWCKPCVHEIPYFEKAAQKFRSNKMKVIFVSLNSIKEFQQVNGFVNSRQIGEEVLLLNSGNPNNWIDTVDSSWSGAIPATVMYRGGRKVFFKEDEFTQTELDSIISIKIK